MAQQIAVDVENKLSQLNRRTRYQLTKAQQRQVNESKPVYIYNVSTIHRWDRFQGQLGTLTIPKREPTEVVSKPLIIPGAVARFYDKGFGKMEAFIDEGMDVAEDICGCSTQYPAESSSNNLTKYGVFLLVRPFEELPKKEQERVLAEATEKYVAMLRELILQADQFHSQGQGMWIADIHRLALSAYCEMADTKEERPWAPVRVVAKRVDCRFCGSPNKPGVPKCANCREIIDKELYQKLQKEMKE